MKFISVRDLRSRTSELWRDLRQEKDFIVTNNGEPVLISGHNYSLHLVHLSNFAFRTNGNVANTQGSPLAASAHRSASRQKVLTRWSVGRSSIAVSINTSRHGRPSSVRPVARTVTPPPA